MRMVLETLVEQQTPDRWVRRHFGKETRCINQENLVSPLSCANFTKVPHRLWSKHVAEHEKTEGAFYPLMPVVWPSPPPTTSYGHGLVRRWTWMRRSKLPKEIKSDEAGDDSRGVWDLNRRTNGEKSRKLYIWSGVQRVTCICQSYHNVEVGNLEAVEQPGRGGEQGGDREGEGQALHVAAAHHLQLHETWNCNKLTQLFQVFPASL